MFSLALPNFKNKYKYNSVVTAKDYLKYRADKGRGPKCKKLKGVIFCYQQSFIDYIEQNCKVTKEYGFTSEILLLNDTNNTIGVATKIGVGSPVVAMLLEQLAADGVKKIVSIGTAGTLQKDRCIGEIMVCNKAIRDEGVSYHYTKSSKYAYASKNITEKIKLALKKHKQNYFVGTSWKIDTPYRETFAEIKKYQNENVATVEMEASALFAVAKSLGVEIGLILVISDSLADLKWKPGHFHKNVRLNLEKLYNVAIDVLK